MVSNIDGTNEQVVASRNNGDRLSLYGLAWSPDGNMIVCPASYWGKGFDTNLIGFDLRNGREQMIGDQPWYRILQVAWQDDSRLIISAQDYETPTHQLWRIHFPDGARQKLTDNLDDYTAVSLSGEKIVTIRTFTSWRLWVTSGDESQKDTVIASGIGLHHGLTWTSKGKIVFSSMVQDKLHISRIDPDGSNQVQLTSVGHNYNPASSADGRFVVFSSNRSGSVNIWRMNADDGSEPIQLTFSDGNYYPAVSPDGQWVAYDHLGDPATSIWKLPLNGGEAVKVIDRYRMPVFSPDSQFIAARASIESTNPDAAVFSAEGGGPLRSLPIRIQEWQRFQWFPNGRELSFIKNENGYSNIWSYNLDTGASKQLTHFDSDQIYAYAWSPDYKQIACQRGTKTSDVTIISER